MKARTIRIAIGTVLAVFGIQAAQARPLPELNVLSSRPDMISGGDALVQVTLPLDDGWTVHLNAVDVTTSFKSTADHKSSVALLKNLKIGRNLLKLTSRRGRVHLSLINHPRSGPIFSGQQQQPFICQTEANGLGEASDANCSAETVVQYYYRSSKPLQLSAREAAIAKFDDINNNALTISTGFKLLDLGRPTPPDVDTTQLPDGRTVPYIIRREVGVIGRAVYRIEFLHRPQDPLPMPWSRPSVGWNGKVVYAFGGGCGAGYRQGVLQLGDYAKFSEVLRHGYALVSSSLNILGNNCNNKVSAEVAAMVKEHFIERFGKPRYTIGTGVSGGGLSTYLIAQNYPGILDGIIPYWSVPDMVTTALLTEGDCALLKHAIEIASRPLSDMQKTAISGFATWEVCRPKFTWLDPKACDPVLPEQMIYDRVRHPSGTRCTFFDNAVNVFGRDHRTGFARQSFDNEGVQYGLAALNNGTIEIDQFLDLNERVGGFDIDGQIVTQRSVADPQAIRAAYLHGMLLSGKRLREIPIIDWNPYLDDLANSHTRDRPFIVKERLIAANGNADNLVLLVTPRPTNGDFEFLLGPRLDELVLLMDQWLAAIAADRTVAPLAKKVVQARPTNLAEGCIATSGESIVESARRESLGRCNLLYPMHSNPRGVAGAPHGADVIKCVLKPVDREDYRVLLSRAQFHRLTRIFANGVCDYSQPGIGAGVVPMVWSNLGG